MMLEGFSKQFSQGLHTLHTSKALLREDVRVEGLGKVVQHLVHFRAVSSAAPAQKKARANITLRSWKRHLKLEGFLWLVLQFNLSTMIVGYVCCAEQSGMQAKVTADGANKQNYRKFSPAPI